MAGAVLETDGVEKSENALARGHQLCTQLGIFEGSLAELFPFFMMLSTSKTKEVSQNFIVLEL